MTTIDLFQRAHTTREGRNIALILTGLLTKAATLTLRLIYNRYRQRRDRTAFMTLLGKEEWVYRDLGVSRGDVEWAARLPKNVNAARELEKIRAASRHGW